MVDQDKKIKLKQAVIKVIKDMHEKDLRWDGYSDLTVKTSLFTRGVEYEIWEKLAEDFYNT